MKRTKKFMLAVLSVLTVGCCTFGTMGCEKDNQQGELTVSDKDGDKTNESQEDTDKDGDKTNESQEDTDKIELSINNFTEFFTYAKVFTNTGTGQYRYKYTIQGVLDFAYYKDVIIRFEVTYQESGNEKKITYMTHTNAAGDVSFWETEVAESLGIASYDKIINLEVKSVSGTVHLY